MSKDDEKKIALNEQQKLFCKYYVNGIKHGKGKICFNATRAYAKAYNKKASKKEEHTCRTNGWRLLTNADIKKYIQILMTEAGYSDDFADFVILELMKHRSWKARRDGVREYNKVRSRIKIKQEHDVSDPLVELLREISKDNKS